MDFPRIYTATRGPIEQLTAEAQAAQKEKYLPLARKLALVKDIEADRVHIFGARFINSRPATFFGRFPEDSIEKCCQLLPGRSLMHEHNTSTPPVGRWIEAHRDVFQETPLVPRSEAQWGAGHFVVPAKTASGAEIAENISIGVYGELSLQWMFLTLKCNICKNDLRSWECGHEPGEVYEPGGLCVFDMEHVVEVLECSIVYAGAERGTHFVNGVSASASVSQERFKAVGGDDGLAAVLQAKRDALVLAAAYASGAGLTLEQLTAAAPRQRREVPRRAEISAVLCSRDRYVDQDDAARACRELSFHDEMADVLDGDFRFRQFESQEAEPGKAIPIMKGMRGVVAKKKGQGASASATLEELCSTGQ